MLELTYVSLLFSALATAYIGIRNDRLQVVLYATSMVLFAAFAYGSYGVIPSFGSGTPVNQPGMFVLGIGGVFVMLIFTLVAALRELPVVGADGMNAQSSDGWLNRLQNNLRGNNRL